MTRGLPIDRSAPPRLLSATPQPAAITRARAAMFCSASLLTLAISLSTARADVLPGTLPDGGVVTQGSASITAKSNEVDVTQTSARAVVNWQSYNIGSGAKVVYRQPDANAVILNRILGGAPSQIMGAIEANGQVFLVNPAGITFGKGASVNVGAFVASVMAIRDHDFMAGRYNFSRNGSTAKIVNLGTINAADGGYVALLAPELRNQGLVSARLGTVALAAGDAVTMTFSASGLTLQVDPATIRTLIDNRAALVAEDGSVILSTMAADRLTRAVINNKGVIEAGGLKADVGRRRSGACEISYQGLPRPHRACFRCSPNPPLAPISPMQSYAKEARHQRKLFN